MSPIEKPAGPSGKELLTCRVTSVPQLIKVLRQKGKQPLSVWKQHLRHEQEFYLHKSNMLVSISLFAILSDPDLKEWPEFDESKLEQMLSYVAWELDPPDSEDSEEDDDVGDEDLGRWRLI